MTQGQFYEKLLLVLNSLFQDLHLLSFTITYFSFCVGLDVPPPDFMRKPAGASRRKRSTKVVSYADDSDEDENWLPGRSSGLFILK